MKSKNKILIMILVILNITSIFSSAIIIIQKELEISRLNNQIDFINNQASEINKIVYSLYNKDQVSFEYPKGWVPFLTKVINKECLNKTGYYSGIYDIKITSDNSTDPEFSFELSHNNIGGFNTYSNQYSYSYSTPYEITLIPEDYKLPQETFHLNRLPKFYSIGSKIQIALFDIKDKGSALYFGTGIPAINNSLLFSDRPSLLEEYSASLTNIFPFMDIGTDQCFGTFGKIQIKDLSEQNIQKFVEVINHFLDTMKSNN